MNRTPPSGPTSRGSSFDEPSSNDGRPRFLADAWEPYPPAESGWLDVSQWKLQLGRDVVVCGRLCIDGDRWFLESAGHSVPLIVPDSATWLRPQRSPASFEKGLLREGDLLAVRPDGVAGYEGADANSALIARQVLLLAPGDSNPLPRASSFDVPRSRQWQDFMSEVRAFFLEQDFIEAATPTLVPSPGTEPFLDPFTTEWSIGSRSVVLHLPTSPEFHLKKLLCRGWTRVFEFKPCFRNGEIGPSHQPEFWMLEWYRAYSNLDAIADDVAALLRRLARAFAIEAPPLERKSMTDLFREAFVDFELRASTTREELMALARREGIATAPDDSFDDVFFRLFLERIEPELGKSGPLLVRGYPPSQAALSRIGPDGFADRFEVYWNGLELANAFHELNDPLENEARFREDAKRKKELGKPAVPIDENLVAHVRHGLPPSGGIALGLERLFMALTGLNDIADARAFPMNLR